MAKIRRPIVNMKTQTKHRLRPNAKMRPRAKESQRGKHRRRSDETARREQLDAHILVRIAEDGPTDGRPDQQADGGDGKDHAQARSQVAQVLGQGDHHDRG